MKKEIEVPVVYRGKPLIVKILSTGIEFHGKRTKERVFVEWLSLARSVLGRGFCFPADGEKGKRHFGAS